MAAKRKSASLPHWTFYRQQRVDGAIRTGLDHDGWTVLERFEPGAAEEHPALLWHVDVGWTGKGLKFSSPEAARQWFLEQKDIAVPALRQAAEQLQAGVDCFLPYRRDWSVPGGRLKMFVIASGIRRREALEIADKVRDVGDHWEEYLQSLAPMVWA